MRRPNLLFKTSGKKDITIAVAFPFFWTNSAQVLFHSIRNSAEKYGVNLLIFEGLNSNRQPFTKSDGKNSGDTGNIVYDLISKDCVDGLIICSSAIKNFADRKTLFDLCRSFNPKPMVSIGSYVKGIANIVTDNTDSIRNIINHLISIHRRGKIAFLRGPLDNIDSNERFNAYISILKENGINPDPKWTSASGTWDREMAASATRDIMSKCGNDIDAVICINDDQAAGAVDALNEMEIKVPEQVSVIGFNNDVITNASFPGISSIDINYSEQGRIAIKAICDHKSGIPLEDKYTVTATLSIRQSCGCLSEGPDAIEKVFGIRYSHCVNESTFKTMDTAQITDQIRNRVYNAMKFPQSEKTYSWCNMLIESFISEITDNTDQKFLPCFDKLLHLSIKCRYDLFKWLDILNAMEVSLDLFSVSDDCLHKSIIDKARVHLSETAEQLQKSTLILSQERNAIVNSLNYAFNTTNDLDKLLDLLAGDLPGMGIGSCYLSIYEDPRAPLSDSILLLAFSRTGRYTIPDCGIRFKSSQLIPEGFLPLSQQKSLILEPLHFGDKNIGFVLFEFGLEESSFYDLFPVQLSAAIWGSNFKEKVIKAENALKIQLDMLEKSNDELGKRSSELDTMYKKLEINQDMLLMSDKMASIGKLTAGIAHEMNTPLATVRASLEEIDLLLSEYSSSIDDKDITPQDHHNIADDILRSIDLAEKSANHAFDFIKSIKAQTRDNKISEEMIFNISDIIKNVLTFLGHSIRSNNCRINVLGDTGPVEILGSPTKMSQVITNLITNAIDALENRDNKQIIIEYKKDLNNIITLKISDNGCGIPDKYLQNIFVPLFTTKPYGQGTGLGLSIINDIICNDFKGTVDVESEVEKGTTFTIRLKSI